MNCELVLNELLGIIQINEDSNSISIGTKKNNIHSFLGQRTFRPKNGCTVLMWPDGEQLLGQLSEYLLQNHFHDQKTAFRNKEWEKIIISSMPEVLANYDQEKLQSVKNDSQKLLGELKDKIKHYLQDLKPRKYILGCHLDHIDILDKLKIGPVTIMQRNKWLEDVGEHISSEELKQINSLLDNTDNINKNTPDNIAQFVNTLRKGYFVCVVDIDRPMGLEAGREAALIVARLSLTAFALVTGKTASIKLKSMYLTWDKDPNFKQQLILTEVPYSDLKFESVIPTKKYLTDPDSLNHVYNHEQYNCIYQPVGDALKSFLQGNNPVGIRYPKMAYTLFQSLLWFHEGCKQGFYPIAAANFISSVDALVLSKRRRIHELLNKYFGDDYTDEMKSEVNQIYSEKRSRVYHGTSEELGLDWSESKRTCELLAWLCLWKCLGFYYVHDGEDNPKLFCWLE